MSKKEKREINSLEDLIKTLFGEGILAHKNIEVKVGDEVVISNKVHASYLIPLGTKETIGKNYNIGKHKGLLSYFTKSSGIIISTDIDFKYKCGHCEQEHTHDVLIHYKEINQSFYASSNGLKLEEEIEE